jgi:hypothetical protein
LGETVALGGVEASAEKHSNEIPALKTASLTQDCQPEKRSDEGPVVVLVRLPHSLIGDCRRIFLDRRAGLQGIIPTWRTMEVQDIRPAGRAEKENRIEKMEMRGLSLYIRHSKKTILIKIYDLRSINRRMNGETFSPKLAGFTDFFAQKPAKSPKNQPFWGAFRCLGSGENPDQYGLIVRIKLAAVPSPGSTK